MSQPRQTWLPGSGTAPTWSGTAGSIYVVGHPSNHKCGTLGHKFGLKCCSHDPTPRQLGVQQGPEQWIVGHEEPANVARHQIGAQDPEWQRVVGNRQIRNVPNWVTSRSNGWKICGLKYFTKIYHFKYFEPGLFRKLFFPQYDL